MPQRSERIDNGARADRRVALDEDMRDELALRTNDRIASDHAIRPDGRIVANNGTIFTRGCRVDL